MCEHFEQDRTSFLACGTVHIAHDSQPQPKVATRPTPDMLRITRGQNEARIHAYEKKIITGDTDIFTVEDLRSKGAPCGHWTDAVAIGSTVRREYGSMT